MRFGPVPVGEAVGAVAAHAVAAGGVRLKKGATVTADEAEALAAAGVAEVVVARLDADDVPEDVAAARIAAAVGGEGVAPERAFTGRANLLADGAGVLVVDRERIDRLNALDEAVTLATLPAFAVVAPGQMVGTVKIIPFAAPEAAVAGAESVAQERPLLRVAPFRLRRGALIQTEVPGTAAKVLDKTRRVTADRLDRLGANVMSEARVGHAAAPIADALRAALDGGAELVLVFGASAIADRRDAIPGAVEAVGGRIEHFGMPVDPGNLLLLGAVGNVPVLGAPGCARSPKENGFDWVLARLVAGLPVGRADVVRMGVGGLLVEIPSRPQPRAEPKPASERASVAGVLLAAGRSTRMGGPNKLLADLGGRPVVRHAAEALVAAGLAPVVVVTGHMAEGVREALDGLPVRFTPNPDYAEGLSTSLRAGVAALPNLVQAALVALGDMPGVSPALVAKLVRALPADGGIVVPVAGGRRGNPVLWSRAFFPALQAISGDVGARHLLGQHAASVVEVPVDGEGALIDVDTPEALDAARRAFAP